MPGHDDRLDDAEVVIAHLAQTAALQYSGEPVVRDAAKRIIERAKRHRKEAKQAEGSESE